MCELGDSILLKHLLQQYLCDLSEELRLLSLVREEGILVDDHSHKQQTVLPQLLLSATEEGGPVLLEACNPLLSEVAFDQLGCRKEEDVVAKLSGGLGKDHSCERGEGDVNGASGEDLHGEVFARSHDEEVGNVLETLLD